MTVALAAGSWTFTGGPPYNSWNLNPGAGGITPPASPVSLPVNWYFLGDSQTDGRATETTAGSPPEVFTTIWTDTGYATITSNDRDGVSGATIGQTEDRYDATKPNTDPSFVYFQDSGSQKNETATQAGFGNALDAFINNIDSEMTGAIILTETAFSFGREAESGRDWGPYNVEMVSRLVAHRDAGLTVYMAEVDQYIKALQDELTPADVWFQAGDTDAYHYKGIGNLMIALAMFTAIGYDVDDLDLSGIANTGTISAARKTLCLDIIKGRV